MRHFTCSWCGYFAGQRAIMLYNIFNTMQWWCMAWLSDKIQHVKHQAAERQRKIAFEQAVGRSQNQIHAFWKGVIEEINARPDSCRIPDKFPHQLQAFLATLEVPLEDYPRAEEVGLPVLQLYFLSLGNTPVEHSVLAVALEAGLPVTPQLCTLFAQACAMAPVGNFRSNGLHIPPKFFKCEYPEAKDVLAFAYAVQYRDWKNQTWPYSDKYAQGAKLLEAFGADWNACDTNGVPAGQVLHACLNEQHRAAFAKYVRTTPGIDVNAIVDKRKAEQHSRVAKIKI